MENTSKSKNTFLKKLKKNKTLLFMIAPATLFFLVMSYLPMGGIILAFKNYNYRDGIFLSPWNGFENFKFLFSGGKIWNVSFNTIAYNLAFLIVNHTLQIIAAVFLAEISGKFFKKITQSLMFLPYFISWVVVGLMLRNIFHFEFGFLNHLLASFGLNPIDVNMNIGIWKYIIVGGSAWKWVGYGTILYLAAIVGIDKEIYDAADIDGAGNFSKVAHITIPLIIPQIVILVLLNIGYIFRGDFQMFYQITANNPLLYKATDVIDTFVVRSLLQVQDIGMATAAGLFQSVIGFFILITCNALVKRYEKDLALF